MVWWFAITLLSLTLVSTIILMLLSLTLKKLGLQSQYPILTYTFIISVCVWASLLIYFLLPKIRAYYRKTNNINLSKNKQTMGYRVYSFFDDLLDSIKIASPLTLRGHFAFLLSLFFGFFLAYEKKDFVVLVLSVGGLVVLTTIVFVNFIQFSITHFTLKGKGQSWSFELNIHEANPLDPIYYTFFSKGLITLPLFKITSKIFPKKLLPFRDSDGLIEGECISRESAVKNDFIRFNQRGEYHYHNILFSTKDAFGLSQIIWTKELDEKICIFPKVKKKDFYIYHPTSTTEDYLDSSHRLLDGDYYEHRPYDIGDDVRRINWKMTAKKGEFHIRIPEKVQPSFQEALIFLSIFNPHQQYYHTLEMKQLLEDMVEEVASYSYFLIKKGFKVFLATDCNSEHFKVRSDYKSILRHLSQIQWENTLSFSEYIKDFIHNLRERYIDSSNITLFLPLISEELVNEFLLVLSQYHISCTLVIGRISQPLKSAEKTKDSRLSKLLLINPKKQSKGHLFNWKKIAGVFYKTKLNRKDKKKLSELESTLMTIVKRHLDSSSTQGINKIHFIENRDELFL